MSFESERSSRAVYSRSGDRTRTRSTNAVVWFCHNEDPHHSQKECRFYKPSVAVRDCTSESLKELDVRRLDAKPTRSNRAIGGNRLEETPLVLEVALHAPPGMPRCDFGFVHRVMCRKVSERPGFLCLHLRPVLREGLEDGTSRRRSPNVGGSGMGSRSDRVLIERAREIARLLRALRAGEVADLLNESCSLEWMPVLPREGFRPAAKREAFLCQPLELDSPGSWTAGGLFPEVSTTATKPPEGWTLACVNAVWGPVELRYDGALKRTDRGSRSDHNPLPCEPRTSRFVANAYAGARFCAQRISQVVASSPGGLNEKVSAAAQAVAGERFWDEEGIDPEDLVRAAFFRKSAYPWLFGANMPDSPPSRVSLPTALFLWALDRRHLCARESTPPHHWLAECSSALEWFVRRDPTCEQILSPSAFVAYYLFFKFRCALGVSRLAASTHSETSSNPPSSSPASEANVDAVSTLAHAQFLLKIACLASLHPSMDASQAAASTSRNRLHKFALSCVGQGEDESESIPLYLV